MASNYTSCDLFTHVYTKPETYIGPSDRIPNQRWILDLHKMKMVSQIVDFPQTCEELFVEILRNAVENVTRSRRHKVDPGHIEIKVDKHTVSIKNYGVPIPVEIGDFRQRYRREASISKVEINTAYNVYIPQMIFSQLSTNSSYDQSRELEIFSGIGIGAKITNIFSKKFMVIIHDAVHHLKYTQIWNDNMARRTDPVIEDYFDDISSVQVVYTMDFERFKYSVDEGYAPEIIALLAARAAYYSFLGKTVIMFNGKELNFGNIREFAALFFENTETGLIHYEWPISNDGKPTETIKFDNGLEMSVDATEFPELEIFALHTPNNGNQISFVNFRETSDGGAHINAIVKALNLSNTKDFKPNHSLIVNYNVKCPRFSSQSKSMLHSPTPKITIPKDKISAWCKSSDEKK
ncbi:DNA topoisomerase 2 [uncultured virus]|nr:DNA topoisomerase 2 [uncultured virus]